MYHFSTILNCNYEQAIEKTTELLKKEGFGVLTTIDVHNKFKEKLGVDFRRYKILGACSPTHAHRAINIESRIGVMLPCNVLVQEHETNKIEISAVNPIASMQAIQNEELIILASEITEKLKKVIDSL